VFGAKVGSKLKIVWMCHRPLSREDQGLSGTWFDSMAQALLATGEVELLVISQGRQRHFVHTSLGGLTQLVLPWWAFPLWHGLPAPKVVTRIQHTITAFRPDLLHIWGTEYYWGLFSSRGLVQLPTLLTAQGFKCEVARKFSGELSFREQIACIGMKELITATTIFQIARKYAKWGIYEREILAWHRYYSCHSDWQQAVILGINPLANVLHCDLPLREAFYENHTWRPSLEPRIFFSAAAASPLKGLHVAIQALAILRRKFPGMQLRIAGIRPREGFLRNGYRTWITREIARRGLSDNVVWLGQLTGVDIVRELSGASVFLMSSFLESYSMTIAEAMMVGTPVVTSYVGGTLSLGKDQESCLFFPAGDAVMCAECICRVLTNSVLACALSQCARDIAMIRHDRTNILTSQLNHYRHVLATSS